MIENYLKSFNLFTGNEIEELIKLGRSKSLNKDSFLIKEGAISKEVAFINSGIFRSFYYLNSGEEITYCFTFPNNFITAYSSYISQLGTSENIQALTQANLLVFSKTALDKLANNSINWLRFFKIMAEQQYIELEQRIFILQKEKAEKKYEHLLKNQPAYLNQIPLNYLASYLGITPRHLSRIRSSFLQ